MTDSPQTPEDVLALPETEGFSMLQLTSDENCEARYRNRMIRTPEPFMTVNIPVAPDIISVWVSDHYPLMVRDKDGEWWRAVLTKGGWRKMPA